MNQEEQKLAQEFLAEMAHMLTNLPADTKFTDMSVEESYGLTFRKARVRLPNGVMITVHVATGLSG
jgi:hypothetical protein